MIGAHVSAAGGAHKTIENARAEKLECFQFFSRSPQGGKAPELTPEIVAEFQQGLTDNHFTAYIHAPYFINLASVSQRIYHGSVSVLREELERGNVLGVHSMMAHIGSSKGQERSVALTRVVDAVKKILDGYDGDTWFLLEISAGAGEIIGGRFEEVAEILQRVNHPKLGVCFDTCHAFASGYNLRTPHAVSAVVSEFDKVVGLQYLKVSHVNDSKGEIGDNKDRHEHIGKGKIGAEGIAAFINHPRLRELDMILETPAAGRAADVTMLKKLRKT